MDENKALASEVLKNIIERIKEQYVKPLATELKTEDGNNDFNRGTMFGLGCALTVMQNDIACIIGEEYLAEYGIDIDVDNPESI